MKNSVRIKVPILILKYGLLNVKYFAPDNQNLIVGCDMWLLKIDLYTFIVSRL